MYDVEGRPETRIIEDFCFVDIENPVLQDFFGIWQSLSADGFPRARDADLEVFGGHVRHMFRGDFDQQDRRFMVKFVGSDNSVNIGTDHTGKFADKIAGADTVAKRTTRVLETGKPYIAMNVEMKWGSRDNRFYDVLACPLFDDENRVCSILYLNDFSRTRL